MFRQEDAPYGSHSSNKLREGRDFSVNPISMEMSKKGCRKENSFKRRPDFVEDFLPGKIRKTDATVDETCSPSFELFASQKPIGMATNTLRPQYLLLGTSDGQGNWNNQPENKVSSPVAFIPATTAEPRSEVSVSSSKALRPDSLGFCGTSKIEEKSSFIQSPGLIVSSSSMNEVEATENVVSRPPKSKPYKIVRKKNFNKKAGYVSEF